MGIVRAVWCHSQKTLEYERIPATAVSATRTGGSDMREATSRSSSRWSMNQWEKMERTLCSQNSILGWSDSHHGGKTRITKNWTNLFFHFYTYVTHFYISQLHEWDRASVRVLSLSIRWRIRLRDPSNGWGPPVTRRTRDRCSHSESDHACRSRDPRWASPHGDWRSSIDGIFCEYGEQYLYQSRTRYSLRVGLTFCEAVGVRYGRDATPGYVLVSVLW